MKKQFFLFFGIWLSLLNIHSFSMNPDCEEFDLISSFQYQELAPITDEQEREKEITFIRQSLKGGCSESNLEVVQKNESILNAFLTGISDGQYNEGNPIALLLYGPFGTGKTTTGEKLARLGYTKAKCLYPENTEYTEKPSEPHIFDFIQKKIEQNFNEPCIFFIDELDQALIRFSYENRKTPAQTIIDCIKKAQEINQAQKKQLFSFVGTTNYLYRVKKIVPSFIPIEINKPNLERRVEIFNDLIFSQLSGKYDVSTINQNIIQNLAEATNGFTIRCLVEGFRYDVETNATSDYVEQQGQGNEMDYNINPPLCEKHIMKAIKKAQRLNKVYESWRYRASRWATFHLPYFLFENDTAYFFRRLFMKVLICSGLKGIASRLYNKIFPTGRYPIGRYPKKEPMFYGNRKKAESGN